jgi:hypothetical protein
MENIKTPCTKKRISPYQYWRLLTDKKGVQ